MNLSPEEVRERLSRDLGAGHEPSLDVGLITARAGRTRHRRIGAASAGMAVVLTASVLVGSSSINGQSALPDPGLPATTSSTPAAPTVASPAPLDIRTDTKNNPPKTLIAAGELAVSATYTGRESTREDGRKIWKQTWSLYNPTTNNYDETEWATLDVAPGLELAAVLEGPLPTSRLGIFDMRTREVRRWIELDHPVAAVAWSPNGKTVLATAYSSDPDLNDAFMEPSPRTGFFLVDVEAATASYRAVEPLPSMDLPPEDPNATPKPPQAMGNYRQDFGWLPDGSGLFTHANNEPQFAFYTLDGQRTEGDKREYIPFTGHSAVSPDGKLIIGQQSGLPTNVLNRKTGEEVGQQRALQLLAWADDTHLIALGGCPGDCQGKKEFIAGLFLVKYDGTNGVQLSAIQKGDDGWRPIFTRR